MKMKKRVSNPPGLSMAGTTMGVRWGSSRWPSTFSVSAINIMVPCRLTPQKKSVLTFYTDGINDLYHIQNHFHVSNCSIWKLSPNIHRIYLRLLHYLPSGVINHGWKLDHLVSDFPLRSSSYVMDFPARF